MKILSQLLCVFTLLPLANAAEPNVLIIGDSISIGYTPFVIERLEEKAYVEHAAGNNGDTNRGLQNLDAWLGDKKWDVIHFNWGLHDLCYRDAESKVQGKRDKVRGKISVPMDQYERNLETLVEKLQRTGAKLIWASTTIVPEGEAGRKLGDDVRYNAIAEKIMQQHGIPINDLHKLTASFPPELFTGPGNVHFKKAGYEKLGKQVTKAIQRQLDQVPTAEPQ